MIVLVKKDFSIFSDCNYVIYCVFPFQMLLDLWNKLSSSYYLLFPTLREFFHYGLQYFRDLLKRIANLAGRLPREG